MYFVRKYGSGIGRKSDPFGKVWAEFKCSLCGKITDIDISFSQSTFLFDVERRCPHCHQINSDDKLINLRAQLDKLTIDKSRIDIQIEQLEREINEISNEQKNV